MLIEQLFRLALLDELLNEGYYIISDGSADVTFFDFQMQLVHFLRQSFFLVNAV